MRLALAIGASALALLAAGAALWLRAAPRESSAASTRAPEPEADLRAAAEFDGGAAPGAAQRAAVQEEVPPPRAAAPELGSAPETVMPDEELGEVAVQVVSDEDGQPMEDVHLTFVALPEEEDLGRWVVETDPFGVVLFKVPAGRGRVSCRAQPERALEIELAPGERREATLRVRRDADLDFHLRIADAGTGEPIPGALVATDLGLHPYLRGAAAAVRADELGFAALRLPSWSVLSCHVTAQGYGSAKVQLAGDHRTRERAKPVLLARKARLEGFVLDARGVPVELARVSAKASERALSARNHDLWSAGLFFPLQQQEWAAVSLAGGRYELPGLPAGVDLTLEVREHGQILLQEVDALSLEPGEVRVRDFRLAEVGSIEGVLLDAAGAPARGVSLVLLPGSEPRMLRAGEPHFDDTRTDKKGRFAFPRVSAGTWLIGPQPTRILENAAMPDLTRTAPALYGERAELYDLLYHWKDYASEAERLYAVLAAEGVPDGAAVLDAACGTGAHLAVLARWYRVGGFDLHPSMLAIARRKLPEADFFEADPRTFRVERPVRAIVCLFSAIAYLLDEGELRRAAARCAAALEPGGVLVVEPWLVPKDFQPGHASMQTYDSPELKLCRQCVAGVAGDVSVLDMHWLVARAGAEVEHFVEHHELWMCPRDLMRSAFADAGFEVRYAPDGLMDQRGLFVARRRAGALE